MTDFIRREDAKTFIHDRAIEMALNNVGFKADASDILEHISQRSKDWIDEVPAADVRPVVRGKWEIDNSYAGPGLMNLRCSVCGEFGGTWRDCTLPSMLYKFCPNCGADMREPNLDTTKGDNHD